MPSTRNNETLDEFRGVYRRQSTATERKSGGEAKHIGEFEPAFLKELLSKSSNIMEIVSENWTCCIQKKFAGKCAPLKYRFGTLHVSVSNPALRQEMAFEEKKILEAVRRLPECSSIKKIRFL